MIDDVIWRQMTSSWHPLNVKILNTWHFGIYLDVEELERWIFFFCTFFGSRISNEYKSTLLLSSVTLYVKVTWPWAWPFLTLLTYKVTLDSYSVDSYLFDIRDPKNLQNKKRDHCSSVTRTRDKKSGAQGHVTLTYKVTLESYSVDLSLFEFRKQIYVHVSSKNYICSSPRTWDRNCYVKTALKKCVTLNFKVTLQW